MRRDGGGGPGPSAARLMFFLNVIGFYAAPAKRRPGPTPSPAAGPSPGPMPGPTLNADGRAYAWPDAVRRLARFKAGIAPRPTSHPSRDAKLARV